MKTRLLCFATLAVLAFAAAVTLLRYAGYTTTVLDGGKYAVDVHRDAFPVFGTPGGSSDVHGYCKVYALDGTCRPSYYYLEMIAFASDIEEWAVRVVDGKIDVLRPEFIPLADKFWCLLGFGE